MPSLRELQVDFMHALLAAAPQAAVRLIDLPPDRARARLRVYQGTVRSNFEDALRATFPAVERLVGADYFRQSARELQRRQPSRSGDLTRLGELFPEHLRAAHGNDAFAYLADVARLEWLIQESLLAAEHPPLALEALGRVPPCAYEALRFRCHPALRLIESRYPVLRIWEANVSAVGGERAAVAPGDGAAVAPSAAVPGDGAYGTAAPGEAACGDVGCGEAVPGDVADAIDLDSGGDRLAIMRRRLRLEFHRLGVGEQDFLTAIVAGAPFAAAVERGERDPGFDASAALRRFVAAEALVDFDHDG
jgi:hypothetical protein